MLYESERTRVWLERHGGSEVVVKAPNHTPVLLDQVEAYERAVHVSELAEGLTPPALLEFRSGVPHLTTIGVGGRTAAALLDDAPIDQQLTLVASIADVVSRFHDRGLVHGALTAQDCLIRDDGSILLIDLEATRSLNGQTLRGRSPLDDTAPDQREDVRAIGRLIERHIVERAEDTHGLVGRIAAAAIGEADDLRYQSAAAVALDLQRCANSLAVSQSIPDFALATGQASPTLDLDELVVGREAELEQLAAIFDECGRDEGQLALISGLPGTGKSALAGRFASGVTARGAIVGHGKFEASLNDAYGPLGEALTQIVRSMLGASAREFEVWREEVGLRLGAAAHTLGALVPDLAAIVPTEGGLEPAGGLEARNSMHLAIVGLIESVAAIRPVVLILDDLQWADADAIRALTEVINLVGRNFVFVGTHRNGEFDPDVFGELEIGPQQITLDGLDVSSVRDLLELSIGSSHELDEVAAVVAERTAGNPLFIRELLRRAQNAGVLQFEAINGTWRWDVPGLVDLSVSDNVVELLLLAFDQLGESHAGILSEAGCVGGPFTLDAAAAASGRSRSEVADALWHALDLRLIEPLTSGQRRMRVVDSETIHRFVHDRVAEAAVARIDGNRRQEAHLRYGRHLRQFPSDVPVVEIAHHLNEGVMLIDDAVERRSVVDINLAAATEAMQLASFPSAQRYFEAAIELLDPVVWKDSPELVADLHLGATESSLLLGDLGRAHEWLDTAAAAITDQTSERAIRFATLRLRALVAEQRLNEGIDTAVDALATLGIKLRSEPNQLNAGATLLGTKRRLRNLDVDELAGREPCTDPQTLATQQLIAEATNVSYIVRPNLFPALVRTSLDLTLDNGLMPQSAVSFAHFGVLLVAGLGDYENGYKWGTVARRLSETEHCAASRGSVTWLYYNFLHHWVEPIQGASTALAEAYRDAAEAGDLEVASWAAVVGVYFSFAQGMPLAETDLLADRLIPAIRTHQVQTRLCQSTQQMTLNLMGRSEEPFLLAGESGYDERVAVPAAKAEDDNVSLAAASITKLGLHFWFGDHDGAMALLPEVEDQLDGMAGTLNVPSFHLMNSVIRLAVDPTSRTTRRAVSKAQRKFAGWAESCPANYGALAAYIEGCSELARGQLVKAEVAFDRAVSRADEARLPQYAALARESLADVYERSERNTLARTLRREAHEQWISIGMRARSDRLEQENSWLLTAEAGDSAASADGVERLLSATQAISSEVRLDDLIVQLVDAACDLTDAVGGAVYLSTDDGMSCRAVHRDGATQILEATGPSASNSLIRYVHRTQRPLRLDDASLSSLDVTANAIIDGVASTLTVPITHRSEIVAVLHVEADRTDAFTPEHQQTLTVLGTQLGVSLENVELVGQLERSLDSQEMLTTAQSRFIPTEILRIFETEDIRSVKVGDTVQRHMTVLLSDIRGYSRLVEELSLDEAGRVAIDFLQVAEPAIIGNNGFVQDLRGDEILALFGGSADDGLAAALAMERAQLVHNDRRIAAGLPEVRAGIGMTSGDVMMTMVGGLNRMTCGVVGDAVNLASRIEGLNKRYDSVLLAGNALIDSLERPDDVLYRRMERVRVVNRKEPVVVYEVYDNDPAELRERKQAAQPAFEEAFAHFDEGDMVGALRAFEACTELIPGDAVAALHIEACLRPRADTGSLQVTELTQK